jgi:hypothetical protein
VIDPIALPATGAAAVELADLGGQYAHITMLRPGARVLSPDDVKALHAWTVRWLADRYGTNATEEVQLPRAWQEATR